MKDADREITDYLAAVDKRRKEYRKELDRILAAGDADALREFNKRHYQPPQQLHL